MNSLDLRKTRLKLIFIAVATTILLIMMFFLGRYSVKNGVDEEVKRDTTYITKTDTFLLVKDSIRYKTKLKLDTVYIHDTILIKEQKEYKDSIAHIWISGFESEIDSIRYTIPYKEVIIKEETSKTETISSGWSITAGVYVGGGIATRDGVVYLSPEIGVGVTVGWSWIIRPRKNIKQINDIERWSDGL